MAIKMGVNKKKESKCEECNILWKNTKEMYNIMIIDRKFTLCTECTGELFRKLLKANCIYNERLKNKEDQVRINNANKLKGVKNV